MGALRFLVDLLRPAYLRDAAGLHHGDAVGEREGLALIVRHEDRGDAEPAQEQRQLELHLLAQIAVERAERLVEQQHVGPDRESAGDRDALALAATQLGGIASLEPPELEERHHLGNPFVGRCRAKPARLQPVGDVLEHCKVRKHRVVLEHHRDVAQVRRHVVQKLPAQANAADVGRFEARDEVEQRRFPAAARAEQAP